MKRSLKRKAIVCEIISIIVILIATFWQFFITDENESMMNNWQFIIQNNMLYSILWSMPYIGDMSMSQDKETAYNKLYEIKLKTSDAVNKAIEDRDKRERLANGQGKILFRVRVFLFFIGTVILLFSKWLEFKSEG